MKPDEMVPKTWVHEADGEAKQPTVLERLKEIPAIAWTAAGVVVLAIAGTVLGLRYAKD